jgi:hypothetical protein
MTEELEAVPRARGRSTSSSPTCAASRWRCAL